MLYFVGSFFFLSACVVLLNIPILCVYVISFSDHCRWNNPSQRTNERAMKKKVSALVHCCLLFCVCVCRMIIALFTFIIFKLKLFWFSYFIDLCGNLLDSSIIHVGVFHFFPCCLRCVHFIVLATDSALLLIFFRFVSFCFRVVFFAYVESLSLPSFFLRSAAASSSLLFVVLLCILCAIHCRTLFFRHFISLIFCDFVPRESHTDLYGVAFGLSWVSSSCIYAHL